MRHENWVKMDKRKFPRLALLFNDALSCLTFSPLGGMDRLWEMFQFTPTNPSENQIPKTFRDGTKGHDFHPFDYLLSHQNKPDTMGPNNLKEIHQY